MLGSRRGLWDAGLRAVGCGDAGLEAVGCRAVGCGAALLHPQFCQAQPTPVAPWLSDPPQAEQSALR